MQQTTRNQTKGDKRSNLLTNTNLLIAIVDIIKEKINNGIENNFRHSKEVNK